MKKCGGDGCYEKGDYFKEGKCCREKPKTEKVSQESESFENFTDSERNIRGLLIVKKAGTEAPWLGELAVGLVKIYGIRRRNSKVEFGIGNEELPILAWVESKDFFDEWPQ